MSAFFLFQKCKEEFSHKHFLLLKCPQKKRKKRKKRSPNITVSTRVSAAVDPLTCPSVALGDSPTPEKRQRVSHIMHMVLSYHLNQINIGMFTGIIW